MVLTRRGSAGVVWLPADVASPLSSVLPSECVRDPLDGSIVFVGRTERVAALLADVGDVPYGWAAVPGRASVGELADAILRARSEGITRLSELGGPGADEAIVSRFLEDPAVDFVFQPIVSSLNRRSRAFEVLARPRQVAIGELVAAAARSARGIDIDCALLEAALARVGRLGQPIHAHVNVLPSTMLDARFTALGLVSRCRAVGVEPHRITIECTEHQVVDDLDRLAERVAELRLAGFGFGVDDAGAGHASFVLIARVRPTVIKIDRSIVSGCDTDSAKQGLVQAFVMFARRIGAALVAEGVETPEELDELSALGVDLVQGYLLGRPASEPDAFGPEPIDPTVRDVVRLERPGREPVAGSVGPERSNGRAGVLPTIASISAPAPVVANEISGEEARERFLRDPALTTLVFADPLGRPTAALTRERLLGSFSGQYGYALFAHRPAVELAERAPATVSADESIVNVAVSSTAREYGSLYDDLLVVDPSGALVGLVRFRDLLRALANADLEEARDLNPLTGLPGNRRIEQALAGLLAEDRTFAVSYVDLNQFKRFNDAVGFIAGDRAIQCLGRAIVDVGARRGARFVGHIGGDDFVVVWHDGRDAPQAAFEIQRLVAASPAGLEGLPEGVETPGITIATLLLDAGQIRDVFTLAKRLATLKSVAKSRGRSVHAVARLSNIASPRWYQLEPAATVSPFGSRAARHGSLLA